MIVSEQPMKAALGKRAINGCVTSGGVASGGTLSVNVITTEETVDVVILDKAMREVSIRMPKADWQVLKKLVDDTAGVW